MSTNFRILLICMFLGLLTGCKLNKTNDSDSQVPTEEEKIEAVKEMLKQGLDKAVNILSAENGFRGNDSLQITLPEELQTAIENIKKLPQGNTLINNALSQINRVAESSVTVMAPVISAAIDSMSVDEVNRILASDSAAATAYLEKIARSPLQTACEPIILQSLDKKIAGDITARNTWSTLAENYNKLADSRVGKITDIKPVEVELDGFVTEKILDAVFFLIAKEEMSIRKHPGTRISQSVARSFGWIDDNK